MKHKTILISISAGIIIGYFMGVFVGIHRYGVDLQRCPNNHICTQINPSTIPVNLVDPLVENPVPTNPSPTPLIDDSNFPINVTAEGLRIENANKFLSDCLASTTINGTILEHIILCRELEGIK